jgi:hypothetical protein
MAFALVTIDDVAHVLCATARGVTMEPSAVLARVHEIMADQRPDVRPDARPDARPNARRDSHSRERNANCSTRTPHTDDARDLEASVRRWVSERAAAELLSLPDARNSASHRRLLHAIDRITARAPRAQRAQLAAAAADARTLVARQRGAGSERLLDALLTTAPPSQAGVDVALPWLKRIRTSLCSPGSSPAAGDSSSPAPRRVVLHGMLTLLVAECPR